MKLSKFESIKKLAEAGDANAQNSLGDMYINAEVVAECDIEKVKWYILASGHGDAIAQFNLGLMYEKDLVEAAKWYALSAEQGHAKAQFVLGVLYETGDGVPENIAMR